MISARPRVITDPAEAGPVDWVLVATKTCDVGITHTDGLVLDGIRVNGAPVRTLA